MKNILNSPRMRFAIVFLLLIINAVKSEGQIITTVAGNGSTTFNGDGGHATAAALNNPISMAVDGSGNIYIADFMNNRVRKVTPSGIISTIAGAGVAGYSGDGDPATASLLYNPIGIAVDKAGNVYIVDGYNYRIGMVPPSGIISTIAGVGHPGLSIGRTPATHAAFVAPLGIAIDTTGNIFIGDWAAHCVYKIDTGGYINIVAGNYSAGYSGDGGPATDAQLYNPAGIGVDLAGNLYIADCNNHRIRKVTPAGIISTIAGSGPAGIDSGGFSGDGGAATAARINEPYGVGADDKGNIYFADQANERIRVINTAGMITTFAGRDPGGFSGDGGPATIAELSGPSDVFCDRDGNVFIADFGNNRIRKVSAATNGVVPISAHQTVAIETYPNPGNGSFAINIMAPGNEVAHVTITDMAGRKIMECSVPTNTKTDIHLAGPAGVYLLSGTVNGENFSNKIIVE